MSQLHGRWNSVRDAMSNNLAGTIVVAVEALLVSFVLWGIVEYRQSTAARSESREIVATADQIAIALLDAETGQRGYLLTGDTAYLVPYNAALTRLDGLKLELERSLKPDGEQAAAYSEMSRLTVAKLVEMADTIDARQRDDLETVLEILETGQGLAVMDAIRAELQTIRDIESETLNERIDANNMWGTFIGAASIALAFVTLAVSGWLFIVLRRRQEAAALRASAAAKDEFVGFVSHELRTPIAVIAGNARLLSSGVLEEEEERGEALQEISAGSERLQDIVDTLLSLSKAESGIALAVEPVLLHRIAQTVRRHHRRRFPEREVEVEVFGEAAPALGDRGAIEQVLINLVSNAEKYGAPSTPITIEVETSGDEGRVRVMNRGELLDAHELDHVFEPFFRRAASATAAPGVGLGLTICHRLIAAQGGRMGAEAIPGGGACFSFTLPLAALDDE